MITLNYKYDLNYITLRLLNYVHVGNICTYLPGALSVSYLPPYLAREETLRVYIKDNYLDNKIPLDFLIEQICDYYTELKLHIIKDDVICPC